MSIDPQNQNESRSKHKKQILSVPPWQLNNGKAIARLGSVHDNLDDEFIVEIMKGQIEQSKHSSIRRCFRCF